MLGTQSSGYIKNIARYGGDPSKIAVGGFSAGADIVSRIATNNNWTDGKEIPYDFIKGVMSVDIAIYDPPVLIKSNEIIFNSKFGDRHYYDDYLNVFGSNEDLWREVLSTNPVNVNESNKTTPVFLIISGNPKIDAIAFPEIVADFFRKRQLLEVENFGG
ncbi:hypothetical protein [Burkholderia diffusa]|uniref:hypothetical protein n=1 Tax=Burkholderia diffusa TaxID=488732 RepID=UPI0012D89456|nr:hypothetical protein [Burkholderia diffusa]